MDVSLLYKLKQFLIKAVVMLAVFLTAIFSAQVNALVVLQQASIAFGTDYDTNPTMASQNKKSIWRYSATPSYSISAVENQNRWYATGGLRIERSSNSAISSNRQDPNISAGWERDFERGKFSLVANYNKTSSRVREFAETGSAAQDGSSTGKSIRANWSYAITDRLDWTVGAGYQKTKYSGAGLSNYNTKSIDTGLTYLFNEKISPFIRLSLSDFESNGAISSRSKSQNYLVGANIVLDPMWSMSLGAGVNHDSSAGNGWVADSSLSYTGERYNIRGVASRSVTASGVGSLQTSDQLSLAYGYELSDRSGLGTEFSWRKNRTLNGSETKQLSGFYNRELSELWQMRLTATTRAQKDGNRSASGNVFGISLIYNSPEF